MSLTLSLFLRSKAQRFLFGVMLLLPSTLIANSPSLTIYNNNFAVVRDALTLNLTKGVNDVEYAGIPLGIETQSVILRNQDPNWVIHIHEQGYRGDTLSVDGLLEYFGGQSIQFEILEGEKKVIKPGKILRGRHLDRQAIIEMDGVIRFGLPGTPLFPKLDASKRMKPALLWKLYSKKAGRAKAEISYITSNLSWKADYNLIENAKGTQISMTGWVTMKNQSGKLFDNAKVKLVAGDVNKVRDHARAYRKSEMLMAEDADISGPAVKEKSFDEFHLYTLQRKITLPDQSSKQVEFVRAPNVISQKRYIYDGSFEERQSTQYWTVEQRRTNENYGTKSNKKVWVYREFDNKKASGLGIPLPKGRVRFYREDDDEQLEFVGENYIEHTPTDTKVKIFIGNAFDITGTRVRSQFRIDRKQRFAVETFQIALSNQKDSKVNVTVKENLYRWTNWKIESASKKYRQTDSQTIEFELPVNAKGRSTVEYTVRYSW